MPSILKIHPVSNRKDLKAFLRLPWMINAGDPAWVPPLMMSQRDLFDRKKNPIYRDCHMELFLARRDGQPVGRIAAILNRPHNQIHQAKDGFFGFLEGIDDPDLFAQLLEHASKWLQDQGCDRILGPMNPNINYELGVLVEGFDTPPYFMLTHNPRWYEPHILSAGMQNSMDFLAYQLQVADFQHSDKMKRVMNALEQRRKITLRTGRLKDWETELGRIGEIYNDAFAGHWGFVPLSPAEIAHTAADFKRIVNPELVLFAEMDGETVGFLLCLPNYNEVFQHIPSGRLFPTGWYQFLTGKKHIQTVRVLTLGIKKAYQHLGLGSLFYAEIIRKIAEQGCKGGEISWVAADNVAMKSAAEFMGAKVYKRWRIYEKSLEGGTS